MPASVIGGLLLPLYFVSQGTWLASSAHKYGCPLGVNLVNQSPEFALTLFHAVFHSLYFFGLVGRNLLKILILDTNLVANGNWNRSCEFEDCGVVIPGLNTSGNDFQFDVVR